MIGIVWGRVYTFDRTTKINIVDITAANRGTDAGVEPFDADRRPSHRQLIQKFVEIFKYAI